MAEEFVFDEDVPIFEDGAADSEETIWEGDEANYDGADIEPEVESKLIEKFKGIMAKNRLATIPLVCARAFKHHLLGSYCTPEVWAQLPKGTEFSHERFMTDYTVSQLARIANRIVTTCAYTSDGGFHFNRYNGNGRYIDGLWVPSGECHDYVVKATPALEASAMGAGACIGVQQEKATTTVGDRPQTIVKYSYCDNSGSARHPFSLKAALSGFLVLPRKEGPFTKAEVAKSPFVWEALARKLLNVPIDLPEVSPLAAFHLYVHQKFELPKAKFDWRPVAQCKLEMIVYRKLIENSWFTGGLYIRNESFLTLVHYSYFPKSSWGGPIPTSLPNWCPVKGYGFERDGASVGDPNLNLDVKSVTSRALYTGVVWNPSGEGESYINAIGVAVPVGTNFATAKPGVQWCSANRNCRICLVCGPTPFMLCIKSGCGSEGWANSSCEFHREAFLNLWECAASVGFYNFLANLCFVAFNGIHPNHPIATLKYEAGQLIPTTLLPNLLPLGRYLPREENTKVVDAAGLFDKYMRDGTTGASKRDEPTDGHDGVPPKKTKKAGPGPAEDDDFPMGSTGRRSREQADL